MADIPPVASGALPLSTTPTDTTTPNSPPQFTHRSTASTLPEANTCRICRSEGTPSEPLFHPCKCSGSIKHVHQECLMEWLSHSHKKHCELCKTPFRFTKLYDAAMPEKLPWGVFMRRAGWHVLVGVARAGRGGLVGFVWLGLIPWVIRWVWRWFFWIADAAWAREAFMAEMMAQHSSNTQSNQTALNTGDWIATTLYQLLSTSNTTTTPPELDQQPSFTWPRADPSILSSWPYLASLTPTHPRLNRLILDVFEGQLITCVVITGFILVFLIREWVVQQQPLVNLDNLGNIGAGDNERIRRERELLDQARRRLVELEETAAEAQRVVATLGNVTDVQGMAQEFRDDFVGWDRFEALIDEATAQLRQNKSTAERAQDFSKQAELVLDQIQEASKSDVDFEEFTTKLYRKLAGLSAEERESWIAKIIDALRAARESRDRDEEPKMTLSPEPEVSRGPLAQTSDRGSVADGDGSRPPMPERDAVARLMQVQRSLQEAERGLQARAADENLNGASTTATTDSSSSTAASADTDAPTLAAASSSRAADTSNEDSPAPANDMELDNEPMPITNAGPDAKINIKRSGKGKMRTVPEPKIEERMITDDELKQRLEEEVSKEMRQEASSPAEPNRYEGTEANPNIDNPFHPDGERRGSESFGNRVASVFREEFGIGDEAVEELEAWRQPDPAQGQNVNTADAGVEPPAPSQSGAKADGEAADGLWKKAADWFWGDIQAPVANVEAAPPAAEEEREFIGGDGQEAPFVPVQEGRDASPPAENGIPLPATNGAPVPPAVAPPPLPAEANANAHPDPEVLAAAQEAGLDAEAIEDAEDLEGIFELIGLQGPIIGLFQTSAFCMLLVACTILGAVIAPYFFGKLVLALVARPMFYLVQWPLWLASSAAEFVVDITLVVGGWAVMFMAWAAEKLVHMPKDTRVAKFLYHSLPERAAVTAASAGSRLQALVMSEGDGDSAAFGLGVFLKWSVESHASLRNIQDEVDAVLAWTGAAVTWIVETISSGSVLSVSKQGLQSVGNISDVSAKLHTCFDICKAYAQPAIDFLSALSKGALTFTNASTTIDDPSLVYWNSTDRFLAILTGYTALAALAAVYVAADTPITRSESGRKTEKLIRDTLRQAGGVLKVILIISIEMLVFPLYCGLLLDLAFLPLFQGASVATRWAFAGRNPYTFCFVHWFVGTCYMFHFALFVGMCRKILRKGVLWFIRDPDDPTFHPVRDVLERNVATQLRKIAFSALVYGALVILCLGGVIWTIGHIFAGIFPIQWLSTEPVLEFPMDLLLYNFVTPLVIRLFKPSDAVNAMYAWWLRRCARVLRLSHFLFDDRQKDEEGHTVHRSWADHLPLLAHKPSSESSSESFHRDGKYVLTPCNDQYRPPKAGEAFLHSDETDVYIADKDGKKNDHFAKVYVPPFFRLRITLFMVCLWMFSAALGLCATLVPLIFGRWIFALVLGKTGGTGAVNDIYAYSVGAYVLAGVVLAALKGRTTAALVTKRAAKVDLKAWIQPLKRFAVRLGKCAYVYGYLGLVLPTIFALLLQFYLILPLHTWAAVAAESAASNVTVAGSNVTSTAANTTINILSATADQSLPPSLADHTFHVLQDYALGLLYVRIASRLIVAAPTSRAAEAFRRITADGYLNPNINLATRFLVLPVTLIATIILLFPPTLAQLIITTLRSTTPTLLSDAHATKLFRYSYPFCAGCVVLSFGAAELGKATGRWRARIRDEVYLVGERLHNFGERRPPVGTRSVVRKER